MQTLFFVIVALLLLVLLVVVPRGLQWLAAVLRRVFAPQLVCVSDAAAYLVEDLAKPSLRWIHQRLEARFGKTVADGFLPSLLLVVMLGSSAVHDVRLVLQVMGGTFLLLGIVLLGCLAIFIGVLVLVTVGRWLVHVRRWFRWLTTAYLREAPTSSCR